MADFGARGGGRTGDSRAFARACRHAADPVRDGTGRTVIDLPTGTYVVREPHALLDAAAGAVGTAGGRCVSRL